MKLISDIINELVDFDKSIASPLLKTKVLATILGNDKLISWIDQELMGYNNASDVPSYRVHNCYVSGDYFMGHTKVTNHQIPLIGLPDEIQKRLTTLELMEGVASLENVAKDTDSGIIETIIHPQILYLIQDNLVRNGNPGCKMIQAKRCTSINTVTETLSSIRTKLLDFMLQIEKEFGYITEINELKAKTKEIQHIMNQTIINNTGDGNILNTGDNAQINATISISKGNKEQLRQELSKVGIDQADTEELINVIDEVIPTNENPQFGAKVNEWIQMMMGKALNGIWQISIGAAGGIIVELLKQYYEL